jgi:hypothetical protein
MLYVDSLGGNKEVKWEECAAVLNKLFGINRSGKVRKWYS